MFLQPIIFSALIAFALTVFCLIYFRKIALKVGLMDEPGGRKTHHASIPLIGGISMFAGFVFALLTLPISLANYRSLIAGGFLLIIMGVVDDFRELTPSSRLLGQVFAALLATVWGGVYLSSFGNILFVGDLLVGHWGIFISVLAFVTMINALNMLDGVDGLAGGLAFVMTFYMFVIALLSGDITSIAILAVLLAVIVAFLLVNFPGPKKKASVFMGDAGSMFLGFMLAWFSIKLSQVHHPVAEPVTFLWILAIPLFDLICVFIRRIKKRQSPMKADREHFHHVLLAAGLSGFQVTVVVVMLSALLGLVGLLFNYFHAPQGVSFIIFLCLFLVYFFTMRHAFKFKKIAKQLNKKHEEANL